MKKADLKAIKAEGNALVKKVVNVILDQGDTDDMERYIADVLQNGCQSGMVSELIYYHDTTAFYNKYKREINNLLNEQLSEFGFTSPAEMFGEKWDTEDAFAEDTQNQNLLAWYAFEETCRKIADRLQVSC